MDDDGDPHDSIRRLRREIAALKSENESLKQDLAAQLSRTPRGQPPRPKENPGAESQPATSHPGDAGRASQEMALDHRVAHLLAGQPARQPSAEPEARGRDPSSVTPLTGHNADRREAREPASGAAVIVTDLSGLIIAWNPDASRLAGWNANLPAGSNIRNILSTTETDGSTLPRGNAADPPSTPAARDAWLHDRDGIRRVVRVDTLPLSFAADPANRGLLWVLRAAADASGTDPGRLDHEARYHAVLDSIDEGFCIVEMLFDAQESPRDYRFLEVNPAFARHTGLRDVVGRTALEVAPALEQHWFDIYGRVALTGTPIRFENGADTLGGRWFDVYAFRIGDPAGRRIAILFADITARKKAEAALRDSEERFRSFAETSLDAIYIVDATTRRLLYLSPGYERIWGESRDLILQDLSRWGVLLHPDDRDTAMTTQRALYQDATAATTIADYRIIRARDGAIRYIRDTAVPIRDADGCLSRVAGIAQDVTDRWVAEARLAESERRLRALMENIPQLVWRASADGQWQWVGPQWAAFTGMTDDASHGFGWLAALHPDDREQAREAWRHARETGLLEVDFRLRRAADQTWRWFQTRAAPVRQAGELDDAGGAVEWLGTSTDIDDQMRARAVLARSRDELEALVAARTAELSAAEERLRQTQKMEAVGQLTGGIAHDFNNMLQGVAGGLDMARRRIAAGRTDEAGRYLDMAREAVERSTGLTRRLLAFARRQRLEPKPVDADSLVAGLGDLIHRTVGPEIKVALDLHAGGRTVLCDPNELESALLNLCINARDAMPGGGGLTVGTELTALNAEELKGENDAVPGPYAAICVTDTGVGIPPHLLDRVFEPFFTTKPQGQGTGLGLSQVYGFVRQSRGVVRIESEPGNGTTVRLFLPLHAGHPPALPEPPPPPARAAVSGGAVLLVDDEDAVRQPAAARLRELGYDVLEATDGPTALRRLRERTGLQLLITDVGLPNGMNGRQLAETLRDRQPDLPVLFITGYPGATLAPGQEVIGKPFTLDALARRVEAVLAAGQPGPAQADQPSPVNLGR